MANVVAVEKAAVVWPDGNEYCGSSPSTRAAKSVGYLMKGLSLSTTRLVTWVMPVPITKPPNACHPCCCKVLFLVEKPAINKPAGRARLNGFVVAEINLDVLTFVGWMEPYTSCNKRVSVFWALTFHENKHRKRRDFFTL